MFKYTLVAVWSIGLGVLLRDVAQDWMDVEKASAVSAECKSYREHAEFYAQTLAHLLNEKSVVIGNTTAVSCKTRAWGKS